MGRKTQQNNIMTKEDVKNFNEESMELLEDFLLYKKSAGKSPGTIAGYRHDILIFYMYLYKQEKNKFFVDITKRDIVKYQAWLIEEHKNSPARVRRLKAALSSMGNYIEAILDSEYPTFRNFINKIESPINQPVREKTVLTDEQCQELLDTLIDKGKYEKACGAALAMYSGRRKAELVLYKVSYFNDENLVFGGKMYKTPEKIKTKGQGGGKYLTCYTLSAEFKPYYDMWMAERERLGIESEWLFPAQGNHEEHTQAVSLSGWADTYSRILGVPVYMHAFRHRFTTALAKSGMPDSIIQSVLGWSSADMVGVYKDVDAEDEIEDYFSRL